MRDHDPDENSYNRMNDAILAIASHYEDAGEPARAYALRGLVDGWSTHHHRKDVPGEHADYYATAHALGFRVDFHGFPTKAPPPRIVCPHCGNDDLNQMQWQEWVPSTRSLGIYAGGTLYIDADEYNDHGECAEGDELVCLLCNGADFPVPPGVTVEHAEGTDIEARLAEGDVAQCGVYQPREIPGDA